MHHSFRTPFITELARETDVAMWRTLVASVAPPDRMREDLEAIGVTYHSLEAATRRDYLPAFVRLRHLMAKEQVDVLHTHLFEANLLGVLVRHFGSKAVLVTTRHEPPDFFNSVQIPRWKRGAVEALETVAVRAADAVVAPSERTLMQLIRYGVDPEKIRKIPVGIDLQKFEAVSPAQIARARGELGLTPGLSAATVARLAPEKNLPFLLRTWRRVVASRPQAKLLVIGDGPAEAELKELAVQLELSSQVRFMGRRTDVPALLGAVDVVIHTSRTESTGAVLLEALALRKPLITTPVGVVGDYLKDYEHCLVVEHDDETAAVAAVNRIADDPGLGLGMATRGWELVQNVFSMSVMTRSYERLWASLLESRNPRA